VLPEGDLEAAGGVDDLHLAARERQLDRLVEGSLGPDLADGLKRCRDIGTVRAEDRRTGADLDASCGCGGVGTEVVVEAPRAEPVPDGQEFGGALGVGELAEHAVERLQVMSAPLPVAVIGTDSHLAVDPLHQQRGRPQEGS